MNQKNKSMKLYTIKSDAETFEKIGYICNILNKTKTGFMKELIDEIFNVAVNYKSGATLNYEERLTHGTVTLIFRGRTHVVGGTFSMPSNASDRQIDAKIQEEFDRVKKHE